MKKLLIIALLFVSCSKNDDTAVSANTVSVTATPSVMYSSGVYKWQLATSYDHAISDSSKVVVSWNNGSQALRDTILVSAGSTLAFKNTSLVCTQTSVATNFKVVYVMTWAGNYTFKY